MTTGWAVGPTRRVPLDDGGRRWALLREPTGLDEQGVGGRTTLDAVRMLDGLLVDDPQATVKPGAAATLTVVERDLLLAAAYELGWGPRIAGVATCASCAAPFDLDFELDALAAQVRAAVSAGRDDDGGYTVVTGVRFRLPTALDEAAVLGLPAGEAAHALLTRCLLAGDVAVDGPRVEEAMDRAGSGIDVELAATCPECGHGAGIGFQMQDYLLGTIRTEWAGLIGELHRIATAYHWGLREILSLPRSSRGALVALLDGDPVPRAAQRR